MRKAVKKTAAIIAALLFSISLLFCRAADVRLAVPEDFLVLGENAEAADLATLFSMSEQELNGYLAENGVIYLAVNPDNTKQIRVTCFKNSFSEKIQNLSALSQEELAAVARQWYGTQAYETVTRGRQTLLKAETPLSDSGGDFLLTRYATVADAKVYTLCFYTAENADSSYIEEVLASYFAPGFLKDTADSADRLLLPMIVCAVVAAGAALSFLRDWLKSKGKQEN